MKCKKILSVLFLLCFAYFTYAEETPIPNLYQYKLDNGLMLFVAENHAVPLAYIEITPSSLVRTVITLSLSFIGSSRSTTPFTFNS